MGKPRKIYDQQFPLKAKYAQDPNNFKLSFDDWEAAVFDTAEYFRAYTIRPRNSFKFETFAEAVNFARANPRYCVCAVSTSGRHMVADSHAWDLWLAREQKIKLMQKIKDRIEMQIAKNNP